MRGRIACLTMLGVAFLATAAGAADTVSITLPVETIALKPGPGMETAQAACRACHSLDYVTTQPAGDAKQWEGVVTKMIKVYGAAISEPDAKAIADYLTAAYGPAR
jgi:cytochrome c5